MTNFDRWLTFAIGTCAKEPLTDGGGEEGGWTPSDPTPANPTMRGIEYDEACAWFSQTITFQQFRLMMTRTVVGQIAEANYWEKCLVDLLPSGPDVMYMDGVWNGGGVANLQTTLNVLCGADLTVDNDLGVLTVRATHGLATIPAGKIIDTYSDVAEVRYRSLGKPQFLSGWLGRLGRCKLLAEQIVVQNPPGGC